MSLFLLWWEGKPVVIETGWLPIVHVMSGQVAPAEGRLAVRAFVRGAQTSPRNRICPQPKLHTGGLAIQCARRKGFGDIRLQVVATGDGVTWVPKAQGIHLPVVVVDELLETVNVRDTTLSLRKDLTATCLFVAKLLTPHRRAFAPNSQ